VHWLFYNLGLYNAGPRCNDLLGWGDFVGTNKAGHSQHIPNVMQTLTLPFQTLFGHGKLPTFLGVFWTLPHEMNGSWLIFIVALIMHYIPRHKFAMYAILIGSLFILQTYGSLFVMGLAIAEAQPWFKAVREAPKGTMVWFTKWVCCYVMGVFVVMAHVPWWPAYDYMEVTRWITMTGDGVFKGWNMENPSFWIFQHAGFVHALFALLIAEFALPVQKLLSIAPVRFLARVSFSFYILHPIIIASWVPFLIIAIVPHNAKSVGFATWLFITVLSFGMTVFVAWLFTITVDTWSVTAGKYIEKFFFEDRDGGTSVAGIKRH